MTEKMSTTQSSGRSSPASRRNTGGSSGSERDFERLIRGWPKFLPEQLLLPLHECDEDHCCRLPDRHEAGSH
jgi:hypothetical protein